MFGIPLGSNWSDSSSSRLKDAPQGHDALQRQPVMPAAAARRDGVVNTGQPAEALSSRAKAALGSKLCLSRTHMCWGRAVLHRRQTSRHAWGGA